MGALRNMPEHFNFEKVNCSGGCGSRRPCPAQGKTVFFPQHAGGVTVEVRSISILICSKIAGVMGFPRALAVSTAAHRRSRQDGAPRRPSVSEYIRSGSEAMPLASTPRAIERIERKRKILLRQPSCNFAVILQNPPFPRGRRYRRVFAAHILEYVPRKNAPLPCPHEKIANFAKFPQNQPRSLADCVGCVRGNEEGRLTYGNK